MQLNLFDHEHWRLKNEILGLCKNFADSDSARCPLRIEVQSLGFGVGMKILVGVKVKVEVDIDSSV